jgi:hypothetical protein
MTPAREKTKDSIDQSGLPCTNPITIDVRLPNKIIEAPVPRTATPFPASSQSYSKLFPGLRVKSVFYFIKFLL